MNQQENMPLGMQSNRRIFLKRTGLSLGTMALGSLAPDLAFGGSPAVQPGTGGLASLPNLRPSAKRVIYLFQSGAPSQIDLFDYKPELKKHQKKELPSEVRMGQRLTTMTSGQSSFPVASSLFKFAQHGCNGTWLSELIPHTAGIVDEISFIRSMHTEPVNHDPAMTFCQTGSQLAGKPSVGAWVAYGLGSLNRDLPTFVVMVSRGKHTDQPLYDRLWGSGFLPTRYQGVKLRSGKEPVLYLANPAGCSPATRRQMLDDLRELNQEKYAASGDPEILTRIEQYELAFRMQTAVPDLTDISQEPQHVLDLYGPEVHKPGTYARNCLLTRRLMERDVRFVQLYHMGWDQHNNLPSQIRDQCHDTDQASAGLVKDLKQRGLLDDTLVVWGGEFGRTVYSQGALTETNYGRDHHPRCYTIWLAGGGIKPGVVHGRTDEFSYNILENPVHVRDLNATMLHCLGIDHRTFSVKNQGLDTRLTGVEEAHVVKAVLA
ncbi:MAG: DUF1501 domain-containing protein [Planctomycetia bacterium]|nr:DUF1501 domain-containing protein [Planctomycetia bacterium]